MNLEDLQAEILEGSKFLESKEAQSLQGNWEWLCKIKGPLIAALKIALFFVGRREKEIIQAFIEALLSMCPKK